MIRPSCIGSIVACRMGSERLPGKTMMKICGKPIIELLIERLKHSQRLNKIVIATTSQPEDDPISDFCIDLGIPCTRGSSEDVLGRFLQAAREHNIDVCVRVTGDCPLIDPEIVDLVIDRYLESNCDYTSNVLERTFPRGLDVEVTSREILNKVYETSNDVKDREHVTLGIYRQRDKYRCNNVTANCELNRPDLRLCVDTKEDFSLVEAIFESLYQGNPLFSTQDVIEFLKRNPETLEVNKHIKQKKA